MGLIEAVFGRRPKNKTGGTFETFTAYQPRFTSWSGRIYESELVRAAIDAKARHAAKLVYTVRGNARPRLVTATRSAPNPWMTWPQFLERSSNIYEIQNNLFIVPILDEYGEGIGFYPVVPSDCEVIDEAGEAYLKFRFLNGKQRALPLKDCAIIQKHQYMDDFFGEYNTPLNSTMELIDIVNQGIEEGVKNSATYRFMARLTGKAFDEDITKERKRFDKLNMSGGGGGLLLFGSQMDNIKQLENKSYVVNPKEMELIRENVFNYFGVNAAVLQNKANGDELDAFFNGCIETFAIKMSESLSRMIFSARELNGGNRITFTANRLQYMSVTAKVAMAKELGDRGALMIDEIRELFNYAPLPDGAGQHAPIRGEYYMVDEDGEEGDGTDGKS